MGRRAIALSVALGLVSLVPLLAQERTITLGGSEGWGGLQTEQNLVSRPWRQGYSALSLGSDEYHVDSSTDLLLHFDESPVRDATGRWQVVESAVSTQTLVPRMGTGAGVFTDGGGGLELMAPKDGLFGAGSVSGSFSIEFWLYSVGGQEGGDILSWTGARWDNGKPQSQEVRIEMSDDRLTFRFVNFFVSPAGTAKTIVVRGLQHLVPRSWHHHLIRFNRETGLLEYLVDGQPEAVMHVTSSGQEGGDVYVPYAGKLSNGQLFIGRRLTGMLDELRIERRVVENPHLDVVTGDRGVAESQVYDLQYVRSQLAAITSTYDTPSDTAILFFYRMGNRSNGKEVVDSQWIQFVPGTDFLHASQPVRGRFLQIRTELLPDGAHLVSPILGSLTATYRPDLPPPPPARVVAHPGNGSVTLTWTSVPESDVQGYLIYYGDRPGQYFGSDIQKGISPIDVGNVTSITLTGLTNGKLYYFALSAYDSSGVNHASALSQEVSARPLRVY